MGETASELCLIFYVIFENKEKYSFTTSFLSNENHLIRPVNTGVAEEKTTPLKYPSNDNQMRFF